MYYLQEFKLRAHLARHVATAHGTGEGARPVMKTRAAFYLRASPFTRLARRLTRALRRPRHFARSPFSPINLVQVKHECEYGFGGYTILWTFAFRMEFAHMIVYHTDYVRF